MGTAARRTPRPEPHVETDRRDATASEAEIARARRTDGVAADRPGKLPAAAWIAVAQRVKLQVKELHLPLLAAGVAFRLLLAFVPALVAGLSVWGLAADPDALADRIADLASQLPEEGGALAGDLLMDLTDQAGGQLGWALLATLAVTLWSTGSGVIGLIDGSSAAYGEADTRSAVRRRLLGLVGGVAGLVVLAVVVMVATAAPQVAANLGAGETVETVVSWARWPLLIVILIAILLTIYLVGPDRHRARWRWALPGAAIGAAIWTLASAGFGVYVTRLADLDDTYGPLAGLIVLMLWVFLSSFAILLGAVVNAELERQTAVDTTAGAPEPTGERGAIVADELPVTYRPQQFGDR